MFFLIQKINKNIFLKSYLNMFTWKNNAMKNPKKNLIFDDT